MVEGMGWKPVEFYVSNIGGPVPRVVARFTRKDGRLYMERFDRQVRRWVPDHTMFGYDLGFDGWAKRSSREEASEVISAWGFAADLADAPVTVTGAS